MKGKVKWFDSTKGFGFIKTQEGNDVFVHYKDISKDERISTLESEDDVEFEVKEGYRGPQATNVRILGKE